MGRGFESLHACHVPICFLRLRGRLIQPSGVAVILLPQETPELALTHPCEGGRRDYQEPFSRAGEARRNLVGWQTSAF